MIQILSIFKNVLFKNLRETKLPLLGRWQIEKCNTKLNDKIQLANEDHCGSCNQYATIQNQKKEQPKKIRIKINKNKLRNL